MVSCIPLLLVTPWITISDIRFRRIPNKALLLFWALITIFQFVISQPRVSWSRHLSTYEFAGSLFVAGMALYFMSSSAMGMGDIKFLALNGLLLDQLQRTLQALTYAAIFGLIWALVTRKRSIPFAPSLIGGILVVMTGF